MISHFMTGNRDMTLGVASRLCAVLGYGLTKVGETVTEPLEAPPKTNRDPKGRRPASAVKRGRGRRVDLETKKEPVQNGPGQTGGSGTGNTDAELRADDSSSTGGRLKRKKA